MIKFLSTLMFINSMMFIYSKSPLSLGLLLLIQTMLTSLYSGMMSLNFWYTYTLFLVMIGGMLILFIYISSLSSNKKFTFNKKLILLIITSTLLIMIFIINNMKIYPLTKLNSLNLINLSYEQNYFMKMSMMKLYNTPNNLIMIFMINYLLLTLFITVKITNINMGPLRKIN